MWTGDSRSVKGPDDSRGLLLFKALRFLKLTAERQAQEGCGEFVDRCELGFEAFPDALSFPEAFG